MTLWLIQRFHPEIVALCVSPLSPSPLRALALRLLLTVLRQSVVAPHWFLPPLLLAGSESAEAVRAWQGLWENDAASVVSQAPGVVLASYGYWRHSQEGQGGVDGSEREEVTGYCMYEEGSSGERVAPRSRHAALYGALRKGQRRREGFLRSVVHGLGGEKMLGVLFSGKERKEMGMEEVLEFARAQSVVTQTLAFLPYRVEEEVMFVLECCTSEVTLLDPEDLQVQLQVPKKRKTWRKPALRGKRSRGSVSDSEPDGDELQLAMEQVRHSVTALLLLSMKRFLRKEYRFTAHKLSKYANGQGTPRVALCVRDPGIPPRSPVSVFLQEMKAIQEVIRTSITNTFKVGNRLEKRIESGLTSDGLLREQTSICLDDIRQAFVPLLQSALEKDITIAFSTSYVSSEANSEHEGMSPEQRNQRNHRSIPNRKRSVQNRRIGNNQKREIESTGTSSAGESISFLDSDSSEDC